MGFGVEMYITDFGDQGLNIHPCMGYSSGGIKGLSQG